MEEKLISLTNCIRNFLSPYCLLDIQKPINPAIRHIAL